MNRRISKILLALLVIAYIVMWAGGVGTHVLQGGTPEHMWWAAPVFLLLASLIVLVTSDATEIKALALAAIIGIGSEIVGVRAGFLYGEYIYTDALRPVALGVPLVMASAWMVLAAYIRQMMSFFRLPAWGEVAAASLWMTAIDLLIDPLAAGPLGYWRWLEGGRYYGIPARNFLGWFIVSVLIFSLTGALFKNRRAANLWASLVGLSIIVFFTAMALIHGLRPVGYIGIMLCLLHAGIALLPERIKALKAPSH
jgi:putative membrane protein